MKLYAVTIRAQLRIDGRNYNERDQPVSKFIHLPVDRRVNLKYAPAVFTARANAQKLIDKLPAAYRNKYSIVEFDSGWEDYPQVA